MEEKNVHPGVSGKNRSESWINPAEYEAQKNFVKDSNYTPEEDPRVRDAAGTEHGLFGRNDISDQAAPSDAHDLQAAITEALSKSPMTDISNVDIEAADGMVTLTGTVSSTDESRAIENLVKNIRGVRSVKNSLKV